MIAADKQELESRLKQVTLQIREKEMQVFTDNFAVLSTQSAFLTGLGFGGLTMVPSWDSDDMRNEEIIFYTLISVSIGFNILTLCIASWCMIFGPGLAIRGPDGSMTRAVEGMYAERKWALRFFWVGLFFILSSGIALGWLKFHERTAATMTAIFSTFIVVFVLYVKYITRPRFRFPKDAARKPREFTVAGYDPETGAYRPQTSSSGSVSMDGGSGGGGSAISSSGGDGGGINVAAGSAASKALEELEWLRQRGMLSEQEYLEKKQLYAAAYIDGAGGGRSTLRQRLFGGSTTTVKESFDAGAASVPVPSAPPDSKSGVLTKDGKLQRFDLSNGVLKCFTLQGDLKKEYTLRGKQVMCVKQVSSSHPHTFVLTIGKQKLTLAANSDTDLAAWIAAFNAAR